eukprot:6403671-Amphidinium_carterae.1
MGSKTTSRSFVKPSPINVGSKTISRSLEKPGAPTVCSRSSEKSQPVKISPPSAREDGTSIWPRPFKCFTASGSPAP